MSYETSSLLILRAWLEEANDRRLRVRMTLIDRLPHGDETVTSAATVDEVSMAVRRWLEELLESG